MAPNQETKPIEILLVEDNPGDVLLTQEALTENRILNRLSVAEDGIEAMDFLRSQGRFSTAPHPDLILLDLNLPRKNGFEVLQEIKLDPDLRRIPVVILTTSSADKDILRSYDLHANCYISKPVKWNEFIDVVHSIEHFWMSIVSLPLGHY